MSFRSRRTMLRLASVLAMILVVPVLSSCGNHCTPAADKCSTHAKPAHAGQSVNWSGIRFKVPVGWYPVDVCSVTSLAMNLGYLTTQSPHAQCHANTCGAPVDDVGAGDVLVSADQTSVSLIGATKPNTTIAGRPAQITTSSHTVRVRVMLPHREVLRVLASFGPSANAQRQRLLAMLRGGQPSASG